MADDYGNLIPWRYTTLSVPNPAIGMNSWLYTDNIRIAFLDAVPVPDGTMPVVAAMIIPKGRELDPLFSTKEGHVYLIHKYFNLSRLFLIGNEVNGGPNYEFELSTIGYDEKRSLEDALQSSLMPLHPIGIGQGATKFLNFNDGMICRVRREFGCGFDFEGFVVVDEEFQLGEKKECFRRLRFEKSPGWFHLQSRIIPDNFDKKLNDKPMLAIEGLKFVNESELIDTVALAMLYGLTRVPLCLKEKRALFLGATGGVVMKFLQEKFGFNVCCADDNISLVDAIRNMFDVSLFTNIMTAINASDIIEEVSHPGLQKGIKFTEMRSKGIVLDPYNVVMIDLSEFQYGTRFGLIAPPRDFVSCDKLHKIKRLLYAHDGAVIFHVIAPDVVFYTDLIENLKSVFSKVYKIKMKNDNEFVLIAITSGPNDPMDRGDAHASLKEKVDSLNLEFVLEEGLEI